MKKNMLSRRNALRGLGVCLGLPWLETLAPRAQAQSGILPKRFLPMYFPNGTPTDYWAPQGVGEGAAWQLSSLLEPFASVKEKMLVLTNLENYSCIMDSPAVEPSHSRCAGAFMTCVDSDLVRSSQGISDDQPANGISVDQVIAGAIGDSTAIRSMQVGMGAFGSPDGRHFSLSRSISWSDERTPMNKLINPTQIWDELIGAGAGMPTGGEEVDPAAQMEAERRRALGMSTLDYLTESTTSLRGRLSYSDQQKLDQYLTSARELEQRVNAVGSGMQGLGCGNHTAPALALTEDRPANTEGVYHRNDHADAINDLVVMAFECDTTRIISYMLDDARSEFVYDHVMARAFTTAGSTEMTETQGGLYHELQHAGDNNDGFATITWYLATKAAALLERLNSIPEGDGTMLDNTLAMFASSMTGANHDSNKLPMVLFGGGDVFKNNAHIAFPDTPGDRPLRDLYLTVMNNYFGLNEASFGVSAIGAQNQIIQEILV